jgi:hypothetical protein
LKSILPMLIGLIRTRPIHTGKLASRESGTRKKKKIAIVGWGSL